MNSLKDHRLRMFSVHSKNDISTSMGQSYNSWLWTPGLPDSRTPGLPKSRTPGLPDFWTPLKWKVVLLRGSSYFSDEIFGQYEWQSWALETWERTTTLLMWLWPVRMVSRWKLTRRSWLGRCLLINYITGIITSTPPTSTPTTSTSTTGALSLMRVQNSWISSNHSWMWSWGIPHNILTLIMRFRVPPILVQLQGSPNWPNYDRKWSLEKIWNGSIRLEGLMVWDRIKSKLGLVHCSPNLVHFINPICTRDFGSYMTRGGGGQIFPHPLKMGVMGGRFKNWVGTSYLTKIDARHEDLQLSET